MNSGDVTHVTVRYSPVIARAARADRVVRDRTIRESDDGGVEIDYAVADPNEFVRWSMKWGAEAEITSPAEIRAIAGALAREIAAKYGG
jgi:predicted DNA-binding transcriptional regulator YafY